ncbi:MAG: hypothetical protein M1587_06385 [Thaumarchaeota archaeon]|nr:hypothetical protein [Nitrososphaerota archaeon]
MKELRVVMNISTGKKLLSSLIVVVFLVAFTIPLGTLASSAQSPTASSNLSYIQSLLAKSQSFTHTGTINGISYSFSVIDQVNATGATVHSQLTSSHGSQVTTSVFLKELNSNSFQITNMLTGAVYVVNSAELSSSVSDPTVGYSIYATFSTCDYTCSNSGSVSPADACGITWSASSTYNIDDLNSPTGASLTTSFNGPPAYLEYCILGEVNLGSTISTQFVWTLNNYQWYSNQWDYPGQSYGNTGPNTVDWLNYSPSYLNVQFDSVYVPVP